jgi:hypothetical protein
MYNMREPYKNLKNLSRYLSGNWRDILHRKAGAGDAVGKGRWSGVRHLEKWAILFIESPVKNEFSTQFW